MSVIYTERARVAALTRSRTPDDPELIAARGRLKAAHLAEHIRSAAPELTREQRTELASILEVDQ